MSRWLPGGFGGGGGVTDSRGFAVGPPIFLYVPGPPKALYILRLD